MDKNECFRQSYNDGYLGKTADAVSYTFHSGTGLWMPIAVTQGIFTLIMYGGGLVLLLTESREIDAIDIASLAMFGTPIYGLLTPFFLSIAVFPAMKIYFNDGKEVSMRDWKKLIFGRHFSYLLYCLGYFVGTIVGFCLFLFPGLVFLAQGAFGWLSELERSDDVKTPLIKRIFQDKTYAYVESYFWGYIGFGLVILFEILTGAIGLVILNILDDRNNSFHIYQSLGYVLFHCFLYSYIWIIHFVKIGMFYYELNGRGLDVVTLVEIDEIGRN